MEQKGEEQNAEALQRQSRRGRREVRLRCQHLEGEGKEASRGSTEAAEPREEVKRRVEVTRGVRRRELAGAPPSEEE